MIALIANYHMQGWDVLAVAIVTAVLAAVVIITDPNNRRK